MTKQRSPGHEPFDPRRDRPERVPLVDPRVSRRVDLRLENLSSLLDLRAFASLGETVVRGD